jgi:hypothetical protein
MEPAQKGKAQRPEKSKAPATLLIRPLYRKVRVAEDQAKALEKAVAPGKVEVESEKFKPKQVNLKGGVCYARI